MEKTNLNESIIKIRVDLQSSTIKKSGKNTFQGFTYYELSDFLPKLNELMLENGVNDIISIEQDIATLTLIKGEELQTYSIPFTVYDTPLTKAGKPAMQDIQYLGALNTYYKRYLYLNAFGITDGEVIDGMNTEDTVAKKTPTKKVDTKIAEFRVKVKELADKRGLNIKDIIKTYKLETTTNHEDFKTAIALLELTEVK